MPTVCGSLSITDHDSLEGYGEVVAAGLGATAGEAGPQLLAGVEINTVGDEVYAGVGLGRDGAEIHVLGYGMRPEDERLAATLDRQRQGRRVRLELTLERLRGLGMPVDEQLQALAPEASDALGRPHVARALVAAGYADSVDDAFDRWLDHGRPAHIRRQGLGPREAIEAIAAAGGVPVLAHSPMAVEHADVIRVLQGWGLRGLEVYYRTFAPGHGGQVEGLRQGARAAGHRRQRLPWRHHELRRGNRPPRTCPTSWESACWRRWPHEHAQPARARHGAAGRRRARWRPAPARRVQSLQRPRRASPSSSPTRWPCPASMSGPSAAR